MIAAPINIEQIVTSLGLPPESRVDQRVPKKLLIENGAPTAGDKRQITDGVDDLTWIAALKPAGVGVPIYHDAEREVLEIAVLSATLRVGTKADRLIELIHRAIPYPVFLVTAQHRDISLSCARKRLSQNEADRTVLEMPPIVCTLDGDATTNSAAAELITRLALSAQPRTHLWAFYLGWIACLEAIQAAQITGRADVSADSAVQETRRHALAEHARIVSTIDGLRSRAEKEKQLNRRVELNLEMKRLEGQLAAVMAQL